MWPNDKYTEKNEWILVPRVHDAICTFSPHFLSLAVNHRLVLDIVGSLQLTRDGRRSEPGSNETFYFFILHAGKGM